MPIIYSNSQEFHKCSLCNKLKGCQNECSYFCIAGYHTVGNGFVCFNCMDDIKKRYTNAS